MLRKDRKSEETIAVGTVVSPSMIQTVGGWLSDGFVVHIGASEGVSGWLFPRALADKVCLRQSSRQLGQGTMVCVCGDS